MRSLNDTIMNSTDAGTFTSESVNLEYINGYAIRHTIADSTPGADAVLAGEVAIETLNFDTQANTGDGDYVVVFDTTGQAWAVAADKTGSSAEPTGATWLAIPAANKAQADINASTTDVDVAAVFEIAFDGISGFSTVIATDDTAADGTMLITNVVRGPVTASVVKDDDDAGAGSIAAATTNAGITSAIIVATDSITSTAHGMPTGLLGQFTTTGTLPAGLSLGTNYYIIASTNSYQVGTSLSNAEAGTQVDITDQGTDGATHTFTPVASLAGTVTFEASVDDIEVDDSSTNWETLASPAANAFTGAETVLTSAIDVQYRQVRLKIVVTSGVATVTAIINGKGI